ncbi:glutamine synthetase family protein [Mangrovibacterium marinum]|uniref:Glutamine synthetase n=1 Tax=Mangrovibacterium marinum TaxID=1639118 RepID=A0A2T5C1U4_9BACT|nr:glutamine synthetase family protein [Mangrovibacterium marinum]PTN08668.1 glutamine synthetase [Mangrovibacterium marinum]
MLINPNPLVQYLQKPAHEFTKDDLIRYIEERQIEMVNFRYTAEDGKLKTINFMVTSFEQLDMLLSSGERVDGSSIFSFLPANHSDLYLIPRYKTAFHNPFSTIPSLEILCSFYGPDGEPLQSSPVYILQKARNQFHKSTGMTIKMMAELEYYVISDIDKQTVIAENGYQSGEPYSAHEKLRVEALKLIARCGGKVRFGHAETGNFIHNRKLYEQHEIEFSVSDPEDAADQLAVAKWILRMLGLKYQVNVTFIPKIALNQPGSGLHIHFLVEHAGKNILMDQQMLTTTSLKMIGGLLKLAPAVCAFANPTPVSYLRLMEGQQTPNQICWGMQNRSTLIRVPLGWNRPESLSAHANHQPETSVDLSSRQTLEYRGADGSANPYLLSAALIMSILDGLLSSESIKNADELKTDTNLFEQADAQPFAFLPSSCAEAANKLEHFRAEFETDQVFPPTVIDHCIHRLRSFNDRELINNIKTYGENQDFSSLVDSYLHFM